MKANKKATRRQGRANLRQKEALVDYLKSNPHVASGKFGKLNAKEKISGSWEELAAMLSTMKSKESDKDKDVASWKTTWRDMKSEVSLKFSQLRKARAATGNMEVESPDFSEMDRKILSIIGVDYIEGSSVCLDAFPEEYGISVIAVSETGVEKPLETTPIPLMLRSIDKNEFVLDSLEDGVPVDDSIPSNCEVFTYATIDTETHNLTDKQTLTNTNMGKRADTSLHEDTTTPMQERKERATNEARLAVQMDSARERFAAIAERQTETLEKLTETIRLQGEAINLLARGEAERNELMKKIVDNNREKNMLLKQLLEALKRRNKKRNKKNH